MASMATHKQLLAVATCEGLMEMLWAQRHAGQAHHKTVAGIRQRMKRDAKQAYQAIYAAGQKLSFDEWEALKQKASRLEGTVFPDGFIPMDAVGMMVELITEQLTFCRPGTGKHAGFDRLLSRARELERYYDRHRAYDDPAGMAAGEALRRIMAG